MMCNSMEANNANQILSILNNAIKDWYKKYSATGFGIDISENVKSIRKIGEHRENIAEVIYELATVNTQMWHEQDGIRSNDDQELLKAIENIHPLNQHRNDLIEEIDEIVLEVIQKSDTDELTADKVIDTIDNIIETWHKKPWQFENQENQSVIDKVASIALINTIIWHEEDRVRERESDEIIINAVRKMNYLNMERNILIESIDSDMADYFSKRLTTEE